MKRHLLFAAAALLLALPAVAQADDAAAPVSSKVCLPVGEIYNFNALDNKTLIITDNFHKKYKVGLIGTCTGLTFTQSLGFDSPGSTRLSCLSAGDSVISRELGGGNRMRCPVRSIEAYTPEMEKADKAAKKQAELDKRMTE